MLPFSTSGNLRPGSATVVKEYHIREFEKNMLVRREPEGEAEGEGEEKGVVWDEGTRIMYARHGVPMYVSCPERRHFGLSKMTSFWNDGRTSFMT